MMRLTDWIGSVRSSWGARERWLSWPGLRLHAYAGAAIAALVVGLQLFAAGGLPLRELLRATAAQPLLAALAAGLAHEQAQTTAGDSYWCDFRLLYGGPLNGLFDVLAFLPAPALWLLLTRWL